MDTLSGYKTSSTKSVGCRKSQNASLFKESTHFPGQKRKLAQESDGTLTVRASGPLDKFTGLQVDGKPVSPENYTAVSGSTVITLKKEFLKTLSAGTHKLTICFEDGACSTNLRIKPLGSPKTGESELRIWCSMLLTSCALMCCVALIAKKRCCSR